jgi:hypothetical protein
MSGRAIFAMHRAHEARLRHDYVGAAVAFGQALLSSPRGSLRTAWRSVENDLLGGRSVVGFIRSRSKSPREPLPVVTRYSD